MRGHHFRHHTAYRGDGAIGRVPLYLRRRPARRYAAIDIAALPSYTQQPLRLTRGKRRRPPPAERRPLRRDDGGVARSAVAGLAEILAAARQHGYGYGSNAETLVRQRLCVLICDAF